MSNKATIDVQLVYCLLLLNHRKGHLFKCKSNLELIFPCCKYFSHSIYIPTRMPELRVASFIFLPLFKGYQFVVSHSNDFCSKILFLSFCSLTFFFLRKKCVLKSIEKATMAWECFHKIYNLLLNVLSQRLYN